MPDITLADLDGLAGFAALINGILLWPTIRALKALEPRVAKLEAAAAPKRKRGRVRAR